MAYSQSSLKNTVFGNKRVRLIQGTIADNDTSAEIDTGLSAIDYVEVHFQDSTSGITYTVSAGVVTLGFADQNATKIVSLMAIGH